MGSHIGHENDLYLTNLLLISFEIAKLATLHPLNLAYLIVLQPPKRNFMDHLRILNYDL